MTAAAGKKVYVLRVNPQLVQGWARELVLTPEITYPTRARAEIERQFRGSDAFVIDEIETDVS